MKRKTKAAGWTEGFAKGKENKKKGITKRDCWWIKVLRWFARNLIIIFSINFYIKINIKSLSKLGFQNLNQ